nr:MAG TPA: hypothetical protein [Caudoviricetes sp.]
MEQKYQLRIAIVAALARYELPQNFETVILDDAILSVFGRATLSETQINRIRTEWNALTENGYLVPVAGYSDYRKLAPEVRSSVKEATANPLLPERILPGDTFFWGIEAVK